MARRGAAAAGPSGRRSPRAVGRPARRATGRAGDLRGARRPARPSAGLATRLPAPSPWTVYVLRCADGTLYTGATNDVSRRLARHAAGRGARYTRARLPVKLVYSEAAAGRGAALRREAALKRLTRGEKLALVRGAAGG